jgi:hypothetical protein
MLITEHLKTLFAWCKYMQNLNRKPGAINFKQSTESCSISCLSLLPSLTMTFLEWFYCKPHTCVPTAYWKGSPLKYSRWEAMHLAQRYCHCWKYFWNSSWGVALSAVDTLFGCRQYFDISVPLRYTLFGNRSHSEPNLGMRVGVPFW